MLIIKLSQSPSFTMYRDPNNWNNQTNRRKTNIFEFSHKNGALSFPVMGNYMFTKLSVFASLWLASHVFIIQPGPSNHEIFEYIPN